MKKSGTNKIACLLCAFALIIAVTALGARPVYASDGKDCVKILLVGNSLTKYGEHKKGRTVQSHLERMAKASGKDVLVKTIAHGGARLKQYAGMTTSKKNYKDEFLDALGAEDWDYVILQEYSKTPYLEFERDTLPGLKWLKKQIQKRNCAVTGNFAPALRPHTIRLRFQRCRRYAYSQYRIFQYHAHLFGKHRIQSHFAWCIPAEILCSSHRNAFPGALSGLCFRSPARFLPYPV